MKATQGFTLVEIILALGVAGLAIVGIMALLPAGIESSRNAQVDMEAANLAQRVLEENVAAKDFSGGVSWATSEFSKDVAANVMYVYTTGYDPPWQILEGKYKARVVGARPIPGYNNALYEVTVAVGFPSDVPEEQRTWVRFTTYVSKRTP